MKYILTISIFIAYYASFATCFASDNLSSAVSAEDLLAAYDAAKKPQIGNHIDIKPSTQTQKADPLLQYVQDMSNAPDTSNGPSSIPPVKVVSTLILSSDFFAKERNHDYKGMIDMATKAIGLNPKDVFAYTERAQAERELNNLDAAINDCTQAIRLEPINGNAYHMRGSIKALKRDYRGAIDDYNKFFSLAPKDIGVDNYIIRAAYKRQVHDYKGAIDDYGKALALDPKDSSVYVDRARVKLDLDNFKGAVSDVTKAIQLDPNDEYMYLLRSTYLWIAGDSKGAVSDLNKAKRLAKKSSDHYWGRYSKKINQWNVMSYEIWMAGSRKILARQ